MPRTWLCPNISPPSTPPSVARWNASDRRRRLVERLAFLLSFEATEIPVTYLLERFLPTFLPTFLETSLKAFSFVSLYERFNESIGQIAFSDHNDSFR